MIRYDKLEKLGNGTFGRVYRIRRRQDQKIIALKIVDLNVDDNEIDPRKIHMEDLKRQEGKLLSELNHPNIATFIDVEYRPTELRIYMEYYKHQSLDHLKNRYRAANNLLNEAYIWSIIYQLTSALVYCHCGVLVTATESEELPLPEREQTVLHRDIKPANVFLASESETALDSIKLGDFGVGTVIQAMPSSTYVGTKQYCPPEIQQGKDIHISRWTVKCDIFSLGCTIFEICRLRRPFVFHVAEPEDVAISIGEDYSPNLQQCIKQCIDHDPAARPDAWALFLNARRHLRSSVALREYSLVVAATRGDFQTVKEQIESGTNVHAYSSTNEETVLHKAILYGDPSMVQYLLDEGADPTRVTKEGHTALHTAAAYAPEETRAYIVRMLLDHKLVKRYDKHGRLPLHCAAAQNNRDVIPILKEFGADLEACTKTPDQSTAMHIAAENSCLEAMQQLVYCGAVIDSKQANGSTALHIAAEGGHVPTLLYCLTMDLPINSAFRPANMTALHVAASSGHVDVVLVLLEKGADRMSVTRDGATSMHLAAAHGRVGVISVLLTGKQLDSHSADHVVSERSPHFEVDMKLLEIPDRNRETGLHLAVKSGRREAVKMLLGFRSNCKAANRDGDTPLHLASAKGYADIVMALLRAGAQVNARGPLQNTPLHYAAYHGHKEVARVLLYNKIRRASIEEKTARGDTILHIAAERGNEDFVIFVSEQSHFPRDNVNDNGETALHIAAAKGYEQIVRELLDVGIDAKKRNYSGQTARAVAESRSHKGCAWRIRTRE